ncbi:Anti-sigma regulatory factor (Ser/Thr protein kinase) [Amycolatopsis arida]|uniref:Anti-sigma regulatory factor (Ser/Thr protein kinase) n=1 Tax=Amycolatopsis arida TaxID=587909 RepID=A0A1I5UPJ7_9PSEU|nr:sensor histidine kinase [Amycolatopsis arida]TDX90976.1 anti-sigma regulatory factor (Ser/Thr protein kinase) [Amycolatopsis arida]SFP96997.1 Anti-sigma regulatory factor (Ser/Thr protein kinase) [Amycolatopsis arida]
MTARATGTDTVSHQALLYRGRDEYVAGTVPFVQDALAAGLPVLVAVPPPNLDLLRAELGDAAGEVRLVDMSEAGRNPGRILPRVLLAFADAHPGPVRAIGESVWPGRSDAEYPACARHEALINLAFRDRDGAILCPYDAARLDEAVVKEAALTHPVMVEAGGTRRSADFDPHRVLAERDRPLDPPLAAVKLPFDVRGLRAARQFAVARATELGLAGERLRDVELVVSELVANSVVHGEGGGVLRVWADGEHVLCEVTDAGRIVDPLAGHLPAPPDQLGGRGLLMVHQLADLVRLHTGPGGTTVRAYFRR